MSKRKKRLEKIRRNPKNVTRNDLDVVLKDYGFTPDFTAGSHVTYRHKSGVRITVATHKSQLPAYIVKQALTAIDALPDEDTKDEETEGEHEQDD